MYFKDDMTLQKGLGQNYIRIRFYMFSKIVSISKESAYFENLMDITNEGLR